MNKRVLGQVLITLGVIAVVTRVVPVYKVVVGKAGDAINRGA